MPKARVDPNDALKAIRLRQKQKEAERERQRQEAGEASDSLSEIHQSDY